MERDGRAYIAVVLSDGEEGQRWLAYLILALDDIIFEKPPRSAKRGS